MLDLKLLRDDPEAVRASQRARREDPGLVDEVLAADERRRAAIVTYERVRGEQKELGRQVARATGDEKADLLVRTKHLAAEVKAADADSATGGPDALRGIYPIVASIDVAGWSRLDDDDLARRFAAIVEEVRAR